MDLHWGKFQLLQINTSKILHAPDGNAIPAVDAVTYLGTTIAADGGVGSELNRRLGKAWAEYRKMAQFWKHTSLPPSRKLQVFQATIVSTLIYRLSTVWLSTCQRRQLNGFQARCLRDILRIPHPYQSRISNKYVLEQAGQRDIAGQLLRRQLVLFGRVARAPDTDLRRRLTFSAGSLRLASDAYVRNIGRPRKEWAKELLTIAASKLGSVATVQRLVRSSNLWQAVIIENF